MAGRKRGRQCDPVMVQSVDDLGSMIRQRREALRITQLELDDIAGLPDGYTSKIEGGTAYPVGLALSLYLQALGLVMWPAPIDAPKPKLLQRHPLRIASEQLRLPMHLPPSRANRRRRARLGRNGAAPELVRWARARSENLQPSTDP